MNNLVTYNPFLLGTVEIGMISAVALLMIAILVIFVRKHNQSKVRTELKTSNKYPFKVETLISALGGLDNVVDALGSYSKIKFTLVDVKKIDIESIKKISSGMIQSSTAVTIIFGNVSKPLANDIRSMIN